MTSPAQAPVRASTQEHLDIEEIKDDLVILKDGSCCLVCQTTAVNFDLLSEKEQEATIFAYAALLNSLSFPIQILIRSQQKDVSGYLNLLANQEKKVLGEKFRKQIRSYKDFVEKTVREKEVLDKKFYIIVPFSSLELGPSSVISKAGKKGLPYPIETILQKAKTSLYPKRDHLTRQFSRLGLGLKQLKTQELIKLFYNIYNPEATGFEEFASSAAYQAPLIKRVEKKRVAMDPPQSKTPPPPLPKEPAPELGTPPPPTLTRPRPTEEIQPIKRVQPSKPISKNKPQETGIGVDLSGTQKTISETLKKVNSRSFEEKPTI